MREALKRHPDALKSQGIRVPLERSGAARTIRIDRVPASERVTDVTHQTSLFPLDHEEG